jgi:hypothetical protein
MSDPTFSPQDAQLMVNHVQTAPLQNMQHAAEVSMLIQKFKAWYEHAVLELRSAESRIEAAIKKAITDHENRNAPSDGSPTP